MQWAAQFWQHWTLVSSNTADQCHCALSSDYSWHASENAPHQTVKCFCLLQKSTFHPWPRRNHWPDDIVRDLYRTWKKMQNFRSLCLEWKRKPTWPHNVLRLEQLARWSRSLHRYDLFQNHAPFQPTSNAKIPDAWHWLYQSLNRQEFSVLCCTECVVCCENSSVYNRKLKEKRKL